MNEGSKIIFWHEDGEPWIEGKETWVDLGYVPTLQTRCEFEICFLGYGTLMPGRTLWAKLGSTDVWVGHMGTSDYNDWRLFGAPKLGQGINPPPDEPIDGICIDVGSARTSGSPTSGNNIIANEWCYCIFGPGCKATIDRGGDILFTQQTSNSGSLANTTIKLFAENPNSSSANKPNMYCWAGFKYVKVFEGDTLMMDLIPYLDNGKACFMNTLTNKKYYGLNKDLIYHKDILKN